MEAPLDIPETVNTGCLRGNADEKDISQRERVIFDHGVLKRGDYGDGRVEGVSEEEVAFFFCQILVTFNTGEGINRSSK